MSKFPKTSIAALVALLLAGTVAQAQQTTTPTTKTKVKTKAARSTDVAATPPTGELPAPPADGPRPPRPGDGPDGPGRRGDHRGVNGGPGRPDGPRKGRGHVQALTDFSGTLTAFTADNEDKLYDGFSLKTSTGTETVRFPRHLAQSLMAAAKAGSTVTVTGFRDSRPGGTSALHLVSLTAGGQTVHDQRPARPTTPPTEEATTVRGTVRSLSQDPRGRTSGVVVSDGTLLHLPPAAAEQLAEKLKAGATVAATGTLRTVHPGEVAAQPVRSLRVETITLDGVQFLVH
ncbi:hypothetical protein [Hymenobacter terricola]|uniref:hypothetical protein n=1 Tax=Hymenobacter terricola TaxID=2819236 RepID=UPI001B304A41|nr:hypothetical protein [Hymenobacter terricola]